MRWEFGLQLYELMQRDERVHLLWADVGGNIFKRHREMFGHRCLNVGVCEQATISMAAGMAMQGIRPIVYSILPFLIERAFEQIKIDVDQMNLPVGIVGHSDGNSGPTHQELDARTLMGLCKNIRGYYPETKEEMVDIMRTVNVDRPWFLKLGTII